MTRIILSSEQAQIVASADEIIEVCDSQGKTLGRLEPLKLAEFIAECKRTRNAPGPRYTGAQVRETLRVLQETWDREGPFGHERAMEILEELRKKRGSS